MKGLTAEWSTFGGKDGVGGKNGRSCTAKPTSAAFDLICGNETMASITNGNAENCTIEAG